MIYIKIFETYLQILKGFFYKLFRGFRGNFRKFSQNIKIFRVQLITKLSLISGNIKLI